MTAPGAEPEREERMGDIDTRKIDIGVIGGSGLYRMAAVEVEEERRVETPFGEPSDAYVIGRLEGRRVAFLPRHGRGHRLLPSEINFRANLFGFKLLGVERLLSVSAVGSMKEAYAPGQVVVPDQFIDRTRHRPDTFFGDGLAAHVSFADPVCAPLAAALAEGAAAAQPSILGDFLGRDPHPLDPRIREREGDAGILARLLRGAFGMGYREAWRRHARASAVVHRRRDLRDLVRSASSPDASTDFYVSEGVVFFAARR
jgi:hypothetical protein